MCVCFVHTKSRDKNDYLSKTSFQTRTLFKEKRFIFFKYPFITTEAMIVVKENLNVNVAQFLFVEISKRRWYNDFAKKKYLSILVHRNKTYLPVLCPSSNKVSKTDPKAPTAEKKRPQQMVFLRPNLDKLEQNISMTKNKRSIMFTMS